MKGVRRRVMMASKGKPKRASPKVRKTAELYKSSHNIGNRTARMRVGCYKDTEFAVEYPDGFWDPVKPSDLSPERDRGAAAGNSSPARVSSPPAGKSGSPQKTIKSASGATKRKLDEKQDVLIVTSQAKKTSPKNNTKQSKIAVTADKNSPKEGYSTNDIKMKPTKEVKIILEKHPALKQHEHKKVVIVKGKANKDKGNKETKEKKSSKEINGEKEKKAAKDKKLKEKGKIKSDTKAEAKKGNKNKKKAVQAEESEVKSESSSDYTYDSDDSEMEISFKKRKTEPSTKPAAKASPKGKVKGDKKPQSKVKGSSGNSGSSGADKKKKKSKSNNTPTLEPRAPRIKRTACLNANAIVSALYQTEDPSSNSRSSTNANRSASSHAARAVSPEPSASSPGPKASSTPRNSHSSRSVSPASRASGKHSLSKRRKVSIDADLDEGGDEAFDLYLAEYEEMARETTKPVPSKLSKRQSAAASPKRELPSQGHREPASPKKSTSAKKESNKKESQKKELARNESGKRDKRDGSRKRESGDSNAYDFDSEDDLGPVPGLYKPQFNRDKSPKKYEIRKSPMSPERDTNKKSSAGGKKTTTSSGGRKDSSSGHKKESVQPKKENSGAKGKKKAPPRKDESSSDEFDSSSESEVEEEGGSKAEAQEVPLWPPPKRMASLNASAMMAASTDRNVRKSIDKSPSRETKKDKVKGNVEEKTKEKEKDKKAEDFSERPDKREKSPVKKVDGVRSDGKAEAKVSPMRSNTSQASPSKHQQTQPQPEQNSRPSDHQYSPLGGRASPPRGPGHWVHGMVSPPKTMGGSREHALGGAMKPPIHNPYDPRPGPMVMPSPSPDVQMMSQPNYQRYPPMPAASPEVQVVEVQRTGYYQGYPPPRQQYPGYDRQQPLGYHQGLPPPAHYYSATRGQQGSYPQPPSQYPQSYSGQHSSGQGGGHGAQNGALYPASPPQHHSTYSSSTHVQQSRSQPPPAHQNRQQPPYLDPQPQSSHGYGALHSMQQRYGSQPGGYPPGHQQQNKTPGRHPPPAVYPQRTPQASPGQQSQQQQQVSPGQPANRGQSQQPASQGVGGGVGSYQHSGGSGSTGSNGSSSGSNSSSSSSSAGGASGSSSSSSGASGTGVGAQQQQQDSSSTTNNSNNTNSGVVDSSSPGGEFTNPNSNTASPYTQYANSPVVPSQGAVQYPYTAGAMSSSSSSYRMMLSRGPFNSSAFTSPPGFHHSYGMPSNDLDMNNDRRLSSPFDMNGSGDQGYYQTAGPMMQALGEACCIQPMPYHFHQQQVKVLVHNPILPSLHPFTSPMGPSIIEIPRETKPSALISPQRLALSGPGGGEDGNNQAQQHDGQQQQHLHEGPLSPSKHPESSQQQQQSKLNLKELPDQKSDIKEPVMGNDEDKKSSKRSSSDSGVVCKLESDKKSSSESSAKNIKLGKNSSKGSGAATSDASASETGDGPSCSKKSKGENMTATKSKNNSDKNSAVKKKKSKDGTKSNKSKDDEKSTEKKKKKKKQKGTSESEINEAKGKRKKKRKKESNAAKEGENTDKTKKVKKKKKKKKSAAALANGTMGTEAQATPGDKPGGEKPKKKKKKSKDKTGRAKTDDGAKPKKKKVVSSKKKLSSEANPNTPVTGLDKNVAKGTKSEAKAKKAGTSTTSTKADPESVSPSLLLSSPSQLVNAQSRTIVPLGSTAAPHPAAPHPSSLSRVSTSAAALSSPKSVGLLIDLNESDTSKAKHSTRETPSPGLTTFVNPNPSPALPTPKSSRKTPSPGKTKSPRSQLHSPLKVEVGLAKGRKTPSPNTGRKTPSPNTGRKTPSPNTGRKTPSPNVRKTPSPNVRKTPSPNVRKTPSPNVRKTPSPGAKIASSPKVGGRKTPSPNVNTTRKTSSPNVVKKVPNVGATAPSFTVNGRKTPSPSKSVKLPCVEQKHDKDEKCPKAKSPGATNSMSSNKDKTVAKSSKKRSDKIKVLKTKTIKDMNTASSTGSVTKKIKKKNLKTMKKKLKVVLGLHVKSAKLRKHGTSPLKQSPTTPKSKSPVQAVTPGQSPRAAALITPKKPLSSPQSGGKPRPRIDDIARRLSIENKERREEKRLSGGESPGVTRDGVKKSGEGRRKEERAMKIKMVPVICPWSWKGEPEVKEITFAVDMPGVERKCYPSIRHKVDGDVINVRDCVLVRSGPKKSDVPYIAKIAALWENEGGEMMMSLLWYYRPEHTDSERLPRHIGAEIFASKHWDQTSVACIDDRCHVLTFNEYCRFKANQKQHLEGIPLRMQLVPAQDDQPPVRRLMPSFQANPETVFLCRRVYDFKMKRILKNPT